MLEAPENVVLEDIKTLQMLMYLTRDGTVLQLLLIAHLIALALRDLEVSHPLILVLNGSVSRHRVDWINIFGDTL